MALYEHVRDAANAIRASIIEPPQTAIVLGSGLNGFADAIQDTVTLRYAELPHWPQSRVVGHEGRLVIGTVAGRLVATLAGRCHEYEGYGLDAVTFAVRVMGLLGVRHLILTNAAGGINAGFLAGHLMIIDDHLNLTGGNPLIGENDERLGPRFPD